MTPTTSPDPEADLLHDLEEEAIAYYHRLKLEISPMLPVLIALVT